MSEKSDVAVIEGAVPGVLAALSRMTIAQLVLLIACGIILLCKYLLVWRLNVNWDEFWFLNHVHATLRGEPTSLFQFAYVHLFTWLPRVDGDEMQQIVAARLVMYPLFALTAFLVWRMASRWASPTAALAAPLCYLAAWPVLLHGGSFRSDSMLAPLLMGALVLVTGANRTRRDELLAGALLGFAFTVTLKAALFAPLVAALICATSPRTGEAASLRETGVRLVTIASAALAVAAALLFAHWLTLPAASADPIVAASASGAARKTLLDVPLLWQLPYFKSALRQDPATWLAIAVGALAAIPRLRVALLACLLALLPIVFYRNAFPYFYVVMLAPASVLAAIAVDSIRSLAQRRVKSAKADWIPLALCLPFALQAFANIAVVNFNDQGSQRRTIAAVHRIFPKPVAYLDHSGMIASFPKANFFMSTWGIEAYRERGVGFVRDALARRKPPLLLVNREVLDVRSRASLDMLLPEDYELLVRSYQPYWGAIHIAGTRIDLPKAGSGVVQMPFAGRYRVESAGPVTIAGRALGNGDVVSLPEGPCTVSTPEQAQSVRLLWADAGPPPEEPAPFARLYRGL